MAGQGGADPDDDGEGEIAKRKAHQFFDLLLSRAGSEGKILLPR